MHRALGRGSSWVVALSCAGLAWASAPSASGPTLKRAKSSMAEATVPAVTLVRDDGKEVALAAELDDGAPVALTFIFTKCGTICPVLSQTFARLQVLLDERQQAVRLVSISIDPEYDTPARLRAYAERYHAGARWRFYTGTEEASRVAQRAFNTFRGDKMDHTPVTFLRATPGGRWERIDGFASAEELAQELSRLAVER